MANPEEVRALFDAAERELGKVDVLVNNAGVLKTMPLADTRLVMSLLDEARLQAGITYPSDSVRAADRSPAHTGGRQCAD